MKILPKMLLHPKFLLLFIAFETLVLAGVIIIWRSQTAAFNNDVYQVLAETSTEKDQEYRACLASPVAERPSCASNIGKNLAANSTMDLNVKVGHCMKLRPYFVRYCLSELRAATVETP